MREKEKIIAYDLGTGGIKASLFDVAGKSYAHIFRAYDTRYEEGDIHEQRPDDWWEGIVETTKLLLGNTGVSRTGDCGGRDFRSFPWGSAY